MPIKVLTKIEVHRCLCGVSASFWTFRQACSGGAGRVFSVSPCGALAVEVTVFAASSWRERI